MIAWTGSLACFATIGLALLSGGAAQAEAVHADCAPVKGAQWTGIAAPAWCGGPVGSGERIDHVRGGFSSFLLSAASVRLCNTQMRVEVADGRGRTLWIGWTAVHRGCRPADQDFVLPVERSFPIGSEIETTLLSSGAPSAAFSHPVGR